MIIESALEGLARTRHRVILRRCMCARPNPHVPMGYTSLVSLYVEAVFGYGVQVIPCGVGCMLYLVGSPVGPLTKASHNGGCHAPLAMLHFINSIAKAATILKTSLLISHLPMSFILGAPVMGHSCTRLGLSVGRAYRSGKHPPTDTPVLLGGCPGQEPAAYDPPKINIHPASSPVHPPTRNRGHVRAPPAHPRGHSRDLEPTPACTRGWEGGPGVRELRGVLRQA